MGNILTVDDSTFLGGVGNWVSLDADVTLSTATTPTPPGGGKVLVLTWSAQSSVNIRIPTGNYSTTRFTNYSLGLRVLLDPANTADPAGILVVADVRSWNSVGSVQSYADDAYLDPMSPGWLTLYDSSATIAQVGAAYVGINILFGPASAGGSNLQAGDKVYIAGVDLSTPPGPPPSVAVGGWGVGQVRMGAN